MARGSQQLLPKEVREAKMQAMRGFLAVFRKSNEPVLGGKRGTHTREDKIRLVDQGAAYYVDGATPDMFTFIPEPYTSIHALQGEFEGNPFDNSDDENFIKVVADKKGKMWALLHNRGHTLEAFVRSALDGESMRNTAGIERKVDPGSILMGAIQNTVFDSEPYMIDLRALMEHDVIGPAWSEEKMEAHLEAVCGTPIISDEDYELVLEGVDMIIESKRRGPQPIASDDILYRRRRESGKLPYGTQDDMAKDRLSMHNGEVVIWLQGTVLDEFLGGALNPVDAMGVLQREISFKEQFKVENGFPNILWYANTWPGNSPGKVLDSVNTGKSVPFVFWSKDIDENTKTAKDKATSEYHRAWWQLRTKFGDASPITQFINKPTDGDLMLMSDLLVNIIDWLTDIKVLLESGESVATSSPLSAAINEDRPYVMRWWSQPLVRNIRYVANNLTPRRLSVQTCRQMNHGLAIVEGFPQLFPSSRIDVLLSGELFGDVLLSREGNPQGAEQRYYNYDPHVHLVQATEDDFVDFYWVRHPKGGWKMEPSSERFSWDDEESFKGCYVVEDARYCRGWGSVVVAWHSALGQGASLRHVMIRDDIKRKYASENKTVDVSGHIIHAVLAHDAHFAWVLEEIRLNLHTEESVYNPTFNEQRKGLYHTIMDYRAGLEAAARFELPAYAKRNISISHQMLNSIEWVIGN